MGGPWNDYATPQNVAGMVAAEASRQGVDPDLAVRLAKQESGFNHAARSPKGAIGVMQLMPDTAKTLGVDPTDLNDNIRGGVTYLKQQGDRFGSPRLAAAAYNAGPGAVAQHGGVPPFKETQDYVNAVAPGGSDQTPPWMDYAPPQTQAAPEAPPMAPDATPAPQAATQSGLADVLNPQTGKLYNPAQQAAYKGLMASGKLDPNASPGSEAFPRGLSDPHDTPNPGDWYVDLQGQLKQAPGANYGRDAWEGATQPFAKVGDDIGQAYRHTMAGDASMGDIPKIAMDAAGMIPAGILGAFTRPAADAARQVLPTPYAKPRLTMRDGKVVVDGPRPLHGTEALDATQNILDTSLSGIRPGKGIEFARPGPMSLDELKAAKDAQYAKVDASGFKFPQADVQNIADAVAAKIREMGGPKAAKLLGPSDVVHARLDALAKQPDGVPLSQLDKLRGDVYGLLVKPGGPDSVIGSEIRRQIDGLIDASDAPDIREARDLNTRVMKTQAVTDKLDSADLRSSSTYSGGNYQNAVRQNLRPLVDPTSAQKIGNLTSDESAAIRRAVQGTGGQNLTRYASKFLTNKFVQVPASLMTHGIATPIMEAGGAVLNKVGLRQTDAAVQRVIDLIANGGQKGVRPPLTMTPPAPVPWSSPRGLIGGAAALQLLNPRPEAGR